MQKPPRVAAILAGVVSVLIPTGQVRFLCSLVFPLSGSTVLGLFWSAPDGGVDVYQVGVMPTDGSEPTVLDLPPSVTSLFIEIQQSACFVLLGLRGSQFSFTDWLCAVPGLASPQAVR